MSAFGSRDSSVDWDDVDDVEEEGNDVGEEERLLQWIGRRVD